MFHKGQANSIKPEVSCMRIKYLRTALGQLLSSKLALHFESADRKYYDGRRERVGAANQGRALMVNISSERATHQLLHVHGDVHGHLGTVLLPRSRIVELPGIGSAIIVHPLSTC
jgi:hypothetical protein